MPSDFDNVSEELPTVATTCTAQTMMDALVFAWQKMWGETPRKESICVLIAQWALETEWGKACWCWNVGNYKHVPGDGRDYTYFRCNEVMRDGRTIWYDPSRPADRPYCCFKAYSTIEGGVLDYLASLKKHFTLAWPDVLAGNPEAFAHDLKRQNYYTAPENDTIDPSTGKVTRHGYKWGVHSIFHDQMSKLTFNTEPAPLLSSDEMAKLEALVIRTTNEALQEDLQPHPTEES
jgi:hypothetical protein